MKVDYIDTNDMSDNQLLMQYFKKHDTDNNAKLDGLELLKALIKMEGNFAKQKHICCIGLCSLKQICIPPTIL